ncbi:NTPase KAP [Photobacterium phosphoreum]|uniref:KAP family P-loop NTPase fold protein n=1 Tax=Photobacterium phosphoreum TaxID=659 RepID=UPI0007F8F519|nr:P-loop NTPase fold protein [Photobacterium phosphoreum]OBU37623.1 NTPase KAP [Photobacterium phosphoreum]OBU47318.1 NTPase KAP [Photobacterium phosphoreum]
MPQNVEINWTSSTTIEGTHYPKDTLDRAKYAQYLTNFLASKGYEESAEYDDKKRNYVLNLNSEWGSGKTYFLRRWAENLKANHPVVYVDAWHQDYSDDPLMTVISSMTKQLREQAGKKEDKAMFSVVGKAGGLFKALAPAIVGGITKKFTGIDFAAVMNGAEGANAESELTDEDDKPLDMSAAASKAVQYMLDEHEGKAKAISALKESVSQWLEAVTSLTEKNFPAFVLIDELDRCRPSYAVEMLETIKHIFNIKGVVFVVATDTEQLQHAVKVVYGEGFDAAIYLGRFFDARYTLRENNYEQLLEVHCDLYKVSMSGLSDSGLTVWPRCADKGNNDTGTKIDIEKRNLSAILRAFGLSAREAIQVMERLVSTITNMRSGSAMNLYYLVILMCMKEKHPEFFTKLKNKIIFSGNSQSSWNTFAHNLHLEETLLEIHIDTNSFLTEFIESNGSIKIRRQSQYLPTDTTVTISNFFFYIHSSMQNGFNRDNTYSQLMSANRGGERRSFDDKQYWQLAPVRMQLG